MTDPVRYREHAKPGPGACEGCGRHLEKPLTDHCHAHKWVRGTVCRSCNRKLGFIDQELLPKGGEGLLNALLAIRNRCRDCEPLSLAGLAPIPVSGPKPAELTPEMVQAMTERNIVLGQDDVAHFLGVGRTMITVWRKRYEDFPEPDGEVGIYSRPVPGWKPARMGEIRDWVKERGLGTRRVA